MNWDQVMDYFLKVCKRICMIFMLIFIFYFHGMFWPSYFHSRVNPYTVYVILILMTSQE